MSDKTRDKLLPCPFCGGEAEIRKKFVDTEMVVMMRFSAVCRKCGANNDWYTDKDYAITAWNTRKPMERIVERLEEESYDSMHIDMSRSITETWQIIDLDKAIEIVKEEMDD